MNSHFVPVSGGRIHVLDFGGSGPPLIMLHSTGFGAWMWQPLVEALSPRFRLLAPEQRGHGDSDQFEGDYDFPTLASDMDAVFRYFHLDSVLGLGHSSGGTTLACHAALHPGVIQRLLLVEPVLPFHGMSQDGGLSPNPMAERARRRKPGFPSREAMFESFRGRPPFNTWREDVLRLYCQEGTRPTEGGVMLKCSPEHEAKYYEAVSLFDVPPLLAELHLPVRFIWGERGERSMMRGPRAESLVEGAQTKTIPGATHFLPMEKPEVVAGEAIDFFGEDGS